MRQRCLVCGSGVSLVMPHHPGPVCLGCAPRPGEIAIPYPPSVNHYWRMFKNRMVISREGREFRKKVLLILAAARREKLAGRLLVAIKVYPPDNRRRDLDNVLKATLDALEKGGAYQDDSQIDLLAVRRCRVIPNGKIIIQIREFENVSSEKI